MGPDSTEQKGHVSEQCCRIGGNCESLAEIIGRLAERLEPILEQPNPSTCSEKPEDCYVPLANVLRGHADDIGDCCNRLDDIIRRIQL